MAQRLPRAASAVVVGGGIIGNSVAYHLAKKGLKDVLLLERDKLTSGTTWHAAGLMVTFGSLSETSTALRRYTKQLYAGLEAETGQSTGLKQCGFIELATNRDYLHEMRRIAAFNRFHGVDVRELSPREVTDLMPLTRVDDVLAGFYVPDDGRVNPVDAAMALAKGARQQGVQIVEGVSCSGITRTAAGRVSGVETACGQIVEAPVVVNCAGMWARQLAESHGVVVPNQAAEHYYLITDPIDGVQQDWPVVEDPSSYTYVRPETNGGLLVGLFEPEAAAWQVEGVPDTFSFGEIQPDWERMTPFLAKALERFPVALETGVNKLFCGPESFTPDLAPVVGPSPEVEGYYLAAGLNSIGILSGGGIGNMLADWIVHGDPGVDVTGMLPARFERFHSTPTFRRNRTAEALGEVYKCHYPNKQPAAGRGAKLSPLHARLAACGAAFKPVSGWEAPEWFAAPSERPPPTSGGGGGSPSWGRPEGFELGWGRDEGFAAWAEEHRACREAVALFDMSFMAKLSVQGPDAGAALSWLCTGGVDGDAQRITYTQMLDDQGRVLADVTVAKEAEGRFMVVATDTMGGTVEAYLRQQLAGKMAWVSNVSGGVAQINLQGPRSRELLRAVADQDVSAEALPFRSFVPLSVGLAALQCARITYVGELGYELFVPTEQALHVYDAVAAAGEAVGLRHAGLRALNSLRLEKGYRDYGHDIDNTDPLVAVGLSFTCDMDKAGGFRGKEAVLKQKAEPKTMRMLQVRLRDPEPMLFHGEVVYLDGRAVGTVRSGSYGHTLGGAVGLAMVENDRAVTPKLVREGTWEVDVAGQRVAAEASLKPLYDPKNARIAA